jgi:hypothetical protein
VYVITLLRKFEHDLHVEQTVVGAIAGSLAALFEVQGGIWIVRPFMIVLEIREGKRVLNQYFHKL